MLEIFNNLNPFFQDVFREVSVREYARMKKISPPTASSILKGFTKENILIMRKERNLLLFRADKETSLFRDLAIAYWRSTLKKAFEPLREKLLFKKLILFGSISKVENNADSDVDMFVDINHTKLDVSFIEKVLKRKVQIHFSSVLHNKDLEANIKKGIEI